MVPWVLVQLVLPDPPWSKDVVTSAERQVRVQVGGSGVRWARRRELAVAAEDGMDLGEPAAAVLPRTERLPRTRPERPDAREADWSTA